MSTGLPSRPADCVRWLHLPTERPRIESTVEPANTFWMSGGGVKGGVSYGATDEVGFKAADNRVSVNDLHATILHLMGLDHKKLTYRYSGRDFRLTDVAGNVVKDVLT